MASNPRTLTLSSISSRDSLSYTGSKTPMGILRGDALPVCADAATADGAFRVPPALAAFAAPGNVAASRLPPPAARNSLRSIPDVFPSLVIPTLLDSTNKHPDQLSISRASGKPGGIIRCFSRRCARTFSEALEFRAEARKSGPLKHVPMDSCGFGWPAQTFRWPDRYSEGQTRSQ